MRSLEQRVRNAHDQSEQTLTQSSKQAIFFSHSKQNDKMT